MGALAVRVVPVVRAVHLVIGHQRIRAHAPAERLSRLVRRHILVFLHDHVADRQRTPAKLHTGAAVTDIAPQCHTGAVVLPSADRRGSYHHAVRVCVPSGRIGITVVAVGDEHIPRHNALGNDALPTEFAVATLVIVAKNADIRALFLLRKVESQAQIRHLGFLCGKRNVQSISLRQRHMYVVPIQLYRRHAVVMWIVLFGKRDVL